MFSSLRNFISHHKRKFIVTGVVIGGSILAVKYAQKKLRDFQENQTAELIEKARRSCHFDSTEQTCNQTIISLAPNLCEQIIKISNTDEILEQIRMNPDNKLELWDELKISSFTHLTTLVYASSMLVITLRVQLNLLGGYMCKDTILSESKITSDIQQNYLSLIQFFLKDGVQELYNLIEEKVRQILKNYNLKQKLTLADTEQLFWSIQMAVNSSTKDPNSCLSKYVMPSEVSGNILFNKMFADTLDMLESDEVTFLSTNNVSLGFSQLVDNIAEFYTEPIKRNNGIIEIQPSTSKSLLNNNVNKVDIPLAKLIPIINGFGSKGFSNTIRPPSLATTIITSYLLSDKIKMLGANIYEVFSQ